MYDFSKKKTGLERFVFALSLDRNKLSERIMIGESDEVRLRLFGGEGNVDYDQQRPLGQFLIDFEADKDRDWNTNAMLLRQSYEKITTDQARFKKVKSASDFLQKKYESNEPTAVFAAIRTWEEYLKCFYMNRGPDTFTSIMNVLYRPFFLYADSKPWQEDAADSLSKTIHAGESQVELWYPARKRPFECVVAMSSFQPLIFYYLNKIEEWGYVFQKCKVCKKHFLARSRHYELCSEACRKVQAVEAKRQFDDRTKGDRLEELYEAAYFYWYNRLRRLRRTKADTEKVEKVAASFKAFRTEAIRKKTEVKKDMLSLSDFSGWLIQQQDVIDQLMESLSEYSTGDDAK